MNVRSGTASVCPGFDPHRMEQPVVDHLIEQVRLDVGFDDSLEVAAGVVRVGLAGRQQTSVRRPEARGRNQLDDPDQLGPATTSPESGYTTTGSGLSDAASSTAAPFDGRHR